MHFEPKYNSDMHDERNSRPEQKEILASQRSHCLFTDRHVGERAGLVTEQKVTNRIVSEKLSRKIVYFSLRFYVQ